MAVSGNQLTRIGAHLAGVASKLTILAKEERVSATIIATINFELKARFIDFELKKRSVSFGVN